MGILGNIFGNHPDQKETSVTPTANSIVSSSESMSPSHSVASSSKNLSSSQMTSEVFSSDVNSSKPEQSTSQVISNSVSDNPLLQEQLHIENGKNALGEPLDFDYAYIRVTKDKLQKISESQFVEFVDEVVDSTKFNWVSIICDDQTGICFSGASKSFADYGELDVDGAILKSHGTIMLENGDHYSYTATADEPQTNDGGSPSSSASELPASSSTEQNVSGYSYSTSTTSHVEEQIISEPDKLNEVQYVWATATGKRYHRIPNCGKTKSATEVTLQEAESMGLTPCSKCY